MVISDIKCIKQPLLQLTDPYRVWSMDFISDSLYSGRRCRLLNVIDEFNCKLLDVEIDISLPAIRIIKTLERICDWRGDPIAIRVDNGPEFISHKFAQWCETRKIDQQFNIPRTPIDNARVERFNGSFRRGIIDYNTQRSYDALGKLTPIEFLERHHQVTGKVTLLTV